MVLIISAALAAVAAKYFYNRAHDQHPEEADSVVKSMRQSTSVLGAFVNAIVAVLDALQMVVTRRTVPVNVSGGNSGGASAIDPPFGRNRGGDEE